MHSSLTIRSPLSPASRGLALGLALTLGFSGVAAASCALPDDLAAMRKDVIALVNVERKKHHLPGLAVSAKLEKAAQDHACDIAAQQSYSHVGTDGSDLRARLKRVGYRFRTAAENTGRGFTSAAGMVNYWMNSPHHRENILNPRVREAGIGQAYTTSAGGKRHWVLDFGLSR
jgi:uncharacterized protein YkwD